VKITLLILPLLLLLASCQAVRNQSAELGPDAPPPAETADAKPCPAKPGDCPDKLAASDWTGRPVNQLIADWGKPSSVTPSEEFPGHLDYRFQVALTASRPLMIGPWGYGGYHYGWPRPFFFGAPFGFYGLFGHDYSPPSYTCVADVRTDQDGQVVRACFPRSYSCSSRMIFPPPQAADDPSESQGG
jgi:hypothetical protein